MLLRVFSCALVISVLTYPISSQDTSDQPVFRSQSRLVVLDVVVTDHHGKHVSDLKKDDFQVLENGKLQTIKSFEGPDDAKPPTPDSGSISSQFYTNRPVQNSVSAANVLILDALNTPLSDQSNVRLEMTNYLRTIQGGTNLAIVTLAPELRMVQGFTTDPSALLNVVNSLKLGGGPQASPLLQTGAESDAEQHLVGAMAQNHASQESIAALQNFLSQSQTFQTYSRIEMTLQALQQLARFLGGIPGRKNVIWFAGSFPSALLPGAKTKDVPDNLQTTIHATMNMLAKAQMAIYPISASALQADLFTDTSRVTMQSGSGGQGAQGATQGQIQQSQNDSQERAINHAAMDDIARETGGEAFYDTNGLKEAFAKAVADGSQYYTISYVPTDDMNDGSYRSIAVKVTGHYQLAYRRGYFSTNAGQTNKDQQPTSPDPLINLMRMGMPESTQLIYEIHVAASPTVNTKATAGDNQKLEGPVRLYTVEFNIDPQNISLDSNENGIRSGKLEVSIVTYDKTGSPQNWLTRGLQLSIKPESYALISKNGLSLRYQIDNPQNGAYLRTGILDQNSGFAGTIELPLNNVAIPSPASENATSNPAASPSPKPLSPSPSETPSSSPATANGASMSPNTNPDNDHPGSVVERPPSMATVPELNSETDIATFCRTLGDTKGSSSPLTDLCNSALSMHARMPDIICDRRVQRSWWLAGAREGVVNHSDQLREDTVTARVTYRNRRDYYSNIQVNGKLVDASFLEMYGTWSDGEFTNILAGVFMPSSKATFQSKKEESVHSKPAIVFQFKVSGPNNHSYYIDAGRQIWFPAYHGRLWIDKATSQLLRIERETEDMPNRPVSKIKTTIDYSEVVLGDGSKLVLPMNSDVSICVHSQSNNSDRCSHNSSKFMDWKKFGASTNIILNSQNQ
jgi:VWFA-related protein